VLEVVTAAAAAAVVGVMVASLPLLPLLRQQRVVPSLLRWPESWLESLLQRAQSLCVQANVSSPSSCSA
jgi:hypothetical protein